MVMLIRSGGYSVQVSACSGTFCGLLMISPVRTIRRAGSVRVPEKSGSGNLQFEFWNIIVFVMFPTQLLASLES